MPLDLDKIREKLLRSKTGQGAAAKDWFRMKVGNDYEVRIVPVKDGEDDPFKEFVIHYNIARGGFLCPKKNFGEDCPACDFASNLWAGAGEEDVEDKEMAKQLFPDKRYYSPVIVRGEEEKGVRWWSYSKTVYEDLLKLCLSEDYGDITNPAEGTDITISYSQPKGKKYPQTSIQPRRLPSRLSEDDEQVQTWMNEFPDIGKLLDRKKTPEVQEALDEFLLKGTNPEDVSKEEEKYGKKESTEKAPENEIDKAFNEELNKKEEKKAKKKK